MDTLLIAAFFIGLFLFIWAFTSRKEPNEPDISFGRKMVGVSVITMFISVVLGVIVTLLAIGMYGLGQFHHLLTFDSKGSVFATVLYISVCYMIFESLIRNTVYKILYYTFRNEPKWLLLQIASIMTSTLIIWTIGSSMPGAHLNGLWGAVILSVIFHFVDWIVLGVRKIIKK